MAWSLIENGVLQNIKFIQYTNHVHIGEFKKGIDTVRNKGPSLELHVPHCQQMYNKTGGVDLIVDGVSLKRNFVKCTNHVHLGHFKKA